MTALVATVAVAIAATSGSAATICPLTTFVCPGPLLFERSELAVTPRALPRGPRVPVAFQGGFRIRTADGTHPSALRKAVIDIDRDVAFEVDGLPACGYRLLLSRDSEAARRVCRKAIVGSGTAEVELSYPESTPITIKTEITLFNAGAKGRVTRLLVHGFIPIPRPKGVVARVGLEPAPGREGGWRATVEVPRTGDGNGSLLAARIKIRRNYRSDDGTLESFVSARCPDGMFRVAMPELLFRNETGTPGHPASTTLKESFAIPCVPKS